MPSTVNVCILSPYNILPPITGARRRVYDISRSLSEVGVSVVVLHPGCSEVSESGFKVAGFSGLGSLSITRGLSTSDAFDTYLSSVNPALPGELIRVLKKERIDILQLEGPWSIFPSKLALVTQTPVLIYDAHNVESVSVRDSSSIPWMWPYAALIERDAATSSDAVFCVSELDKARMCHLYDLPSSKVTVVPNGICSATYRRGSERQLRHVHSLDKRRKIILFHGNLGWKPNAQAAQAIVESIAPRFENEYPSVMFLIIGPYPSCRLLEQARRRFNVKILGPVSDIAEYVSSADVCIAPLHTGSGTKFKILEYFAARRPVVATSKAVEGMGIRSGREALVTDGVGDEFILAIRTAMNPDIAQQLGEDGGAYVKQFEWSTIVGKVARTYDSILSHCGR